MQLSPLFCSFLQRCEVASTTTLLLVTQCTSLMSAPRTTWSLARSATDSIYVFAGRMTVHRRGLLIFLNRRRVPHTVHPTHCMMPAIKWTLVKRRLATTFPLSLLQVCRQIYHEAALKPFSQTTFIVDESCHLGSKAFLSALVPTQTRAIAHLHFLCFGGQCPAYEIMRHLMKLDSLRVQIVEAHLGWSQRAQRLDLEFDTLEWSLRAVKDLGLKSFHIGMVVDGTITKAEREFGGTS